MSNLINALKDLIIKTGEIALDTKKVGLVVENKLDGSPVSNADKEISELIYRDLQILTPGVTIICEEQPLPILNSDTFWLIDPIDGTKSYISGKDTYTINMGLIKNGIPTIGLIYQPANAKLYYTDANGNLKIEQNSVEIPLLGAANQESEKNGFNAVISFHHQNKATTDFLDKYLINKIENIASSIKLCLIAEGAADLYPKLGGQTMEWDIAAGHALIKASGGNIFDLAGKEISYGKKNFANPDFLPVVLIGYKKTLHNILFLYIFVI